MLAVNKKLFSAESISHVGGDRYYNTALKHKYYTAQYKSIEPIKK